MFSQENDAPLWPMLRMLTQTTQTLNLETWWPSPVSQDIDFLTEPPRKVFDVSTRSGHLSLATAKVNQINLTINTLDVHRDSNSMQICCERWYLYMSASNRFLASCNSVQIPPNIYHSMLKILVTSIFRLAVSHTMYAWYVICWRVTVSGESWSLSTDDPFWEWE